METSAHPVALYNRIKQYLVTQMDSGKLKPDDRVPSETQLAAMFTASRMTANRALKELSEENRIIRIQGVGTFVARPKPDAALLEIKSIAKEIADWGGIHSCEVLLLQ
ncbi:MAG: GntR family transcriptional regulator, partial [Desulfobacteraceae bacterium]|nr:GntR family transcriptional regulator [Desulfobacteraceae bacterium]